MSHKTAPAGILLARDRYFRFRFRFVDKAAHKYVIYVWFVLLIIVILLQMSTVLNNKYDMQHK